MSSTVSGSDRTGDSQKKRRQSRTLGGTGWVYFLIVLISALLAFTAWVLRLHQPILYSLEGLVVDVQTRIRGPLNPGTAPGIIILTVDDRSLAAYGSLPIDRRILAKAVDKLHDQGAAWIGFDMLFPEPSRRDAGSDQAFAQAIGRAGNVVLPYALPPDRTDPEHDAAAQDIILGSSFQRYRNDQFHDRIALKPLRILAPIPLLAAETRGMGHVTVEPGMDGSVRYDQPVLWYQDELYPAMAVVMAALVSGTPWSNSEAVLGESIRIGDKQVPLDAASRLWVNYYGPERSFTTYSLVDFMAGHIKPEVFKGQIVLIGGGAVGGSDRYATPFDPTLPGVERVATVIDNILTQRWVERPTWAAAVELAAMILLPILAVLLIRRLRPSHFFVILLLIAWAMLVSAQALFSRHYLYVSAAFPLLSLLVASALGTVYRARLDERLRRDAEVRLRASEQRYALAAQGANDGLWDWDIGADQAFFSQRWFQLMGLEEQPETTLDFWYSALDQLERGRFRAELEAHLQGRTRQFYHILCLGTEDETRWLLARGVAIRQDDKPVRMAGSLTDMTEQKRLERQVAFDALHDHLTGLANQDLFFDRLQQLELHRGEFDAEGTLSGRSQIGVLLLDLDGFRAFNERHGHVGGNGLLCGVATRLRQLETEGLLVARLSADQFAVGYGGPRQVHLAERVRKLFVEPFAVDEALEKVSVSMALAHSSDGLSSAEEIMNAVALALAHAQVEGHGQTKAFDPAELEIENSRRWLRDNIERALADGTQFQLYYQPLMRLSDRGLSGFEALIRWHHPERGLIMPDQFIPFAEESGQILGIGKFTLMEVARQMVEWDAMGFTGEIAVNVASRQFSESDLEADAREVLAIIGNISSRRIKMEVTESMAMANPQRTFEVLKVLRDGLGFKISIDDFGTGYSSLSYLYRFPFDTLKIDQSFTKRLDTVVETKEIVRTIAGLGAALGKQVLAEGVEEESQAVMLAELGVHIGQGWLFSKARDKDSATEYIRQFQKPLPSQAA